MLILPLCVSALLIFILLKAGPRLEATKWREFDLVLAPGEKIPVAKYLGFSSHANCCDAGWLVVVAADSSDFFHDLGWWFSTSSSNIVVNKLSLEWLAIDRDYTSHCVSLLCSSLTICELDRKKKCNYCKFLTKIRDVVAIDAAMNAELEFKYS